MNEPQRIDPVKGHKPPKAISDTPAAQVPKHRPRTKLQTQASQYAYQQTLPESERGTVQFPKESPFHPDYFKQETITAKRPKLKDKVMNALFTRIWAFIRDVLLQWAFPFPIFKKSADGITPITDDEGKKVIDWVATASARVLSLVAVFWGTVEVLGLPIAEWVQRIAGALGLPIGG